MTVPVPSAPQIQNWVHAAGALVGWLLLLEQGVAATLQQSGVHTPMHFSVALSLIGGGLVTASHLIESVNNFMGGRPVANPPSPPPPPPFTGAPPQ